MSALNEFTLELSCDFCGVEPGEWCLTKSGRKAVWPHGARTWLLQNAWSAGYREANHYAALGYLRDPDWFDRWARREVERGAS